MSQPDLLNRPRRSMLYMPGDKAKVLEKGKNLAADSLIIDLEDAVAPAAKSEARSQACAAVKAGGYGHRELILRMNGLDTEWGAADLQAISEAAPNGILVPKVDSGADVVQIDQALDAAGAAKTLALWVMIETPLSILNIQNIAAAATQTRLTGFVLGTNDLAKAYRAQMTPDRFAFQTSLSLALIAARAFNLMAIDGVYNDIQNIEGFQAECQQGQIFGFDGKTLIHPSQLEVANHIFSPKPEDIDQAKAIIEAFESPENAGKGVLKVNGKMAELLHLEDARRTLSVHGAIMAMKDGV